MMLKLWWGSGVTGVWIVDVWDMRGFSIQREIVRLELRNRMKFRYGVV
jgi:hypothetical protein